MGMTLLAYCRNCKFEDRVAYGGNRKTYLTVSWVPAIEIKTKTIVSINKFEHKDSKEYILYSDKSLQKDTDETTVFWDFDLTIQKRNNYCPYCNTFSLDFHIAMMFD